MGARNLSEIRRWGTAEHPDLGARLFEIIADLQKRHDELVRQVNGDGTPPPPVNGVQVTGKNGYLHVAVTDNGAINRGIRYYAEHSDNPNFTNPQVVPMHDSRNVSIPVGSQTRFVRVYSSYSTSSPSDPVYHGTSAMPIPVSGGGPHDGPQFLPGQGSGTGLPGEGLQGPGRRASRK